MTSCKLRPTPTLTQGGGRRPAFQVVSATEGGSLELQASRHAVSIAHLDWPARLNHEPFYSHLADGNPDGTAPLSATVGDHPRVEAANQAVSALEAGYAAVTIKVRGRPVAAEAERIRAVRSAIGTEADLRLDANGACSFMEARAFLESTSELGLDYLEQPLDPDELAGHARLGERGVDIGLDESVTLHGIEAVREAGAAADVFVLKPMTLGGIDVTRGTARDLLADDHSVLIGTTFDSAVARTGAVHVAVSLSDVLPSPLSLGDFLENDVAEDPVTVVEGTLSVPDSPGWVSTTWRFERRNGSLDEGLRSVSGASIRGTWYPFTLKSNRNLPLPLPTSPTRT